MFQVNLVHFEFLSNGEESWDIWSVISRVRENNPWKNFDMQLKIPEKNLPQFASKIIPSAYAPNEEETARLRIDDCVYWLMKNGGWKGQREKQCWSNIEML